MSDCGRSDEEKQRLVVQGVRFSSAVWVASNKNRRETTMPAFEDEMFKFDVTVRKIATRDLETNEEGTAWKVESENMERPCRGDSAADALRILAATFEADEDSPAYVSVEQLAGD